MKTILALVNEINNSKDFITYVTDMARDMHSDVKILHVENPEAYPLGTTNTYGAEVVQIQKNLEEKMKIDNEKLKATIEEMKENENVDNIGIEYSTTLGITKNVAENMLQEEKVDMVVIEGNQHGGFWVQNSSTMDLVRGLDCPVWVIPKNTTYKPFDEIVYATDYKKEDLDTLKKLVSITKEYNPHITALHITNSSEFNDKVKKEGFDQMVQKQTGYNNITVSNLVEKKDEDIAKLTNDYSLLIDAKLIVALKENRHFLDRIFKSGTTKDIIKKAQLPVLVYHEK